MNKVRKVLWKVWFPIIIGSIFVTVYLTWINKKHIHSYMYPGIFSTPKIATRMSDTGNSSYNIFNTIDSARPTIPTAGLSTKPVCVVKKVALSKTPLPLTGLVSFPGSGNTWTRHLIQQMTGIGTSSVYCDEGLSKKGFPHECTFNTKSKYNTIVVKTHRIHDLKGMQKAVLLIRNPYEAFLAFSNYRKAGLTGHVYNQTLVKEANRKFNASCNWYLDLWNSSLNLNISVYILQYEKLKSDMQNELRGLAKFLNVNITEEDIKCTVKLQEGLYHRNTSDEARMKSLRAIYDDQKLNVLKSIVSNTEGFLEERFHRKYDIGGHIQKVLFESTTDKTKIQLPIFGVSEHLGTSWWLWKHLMGNLKS